MPSDSRTCQTHLRRATSTSPGRTCRRSLAGVRHRRRCSALSRGWSGSRWQSARPSRSGLRRAAHGRRRSATQPEDAGEREAAVRGAVRLRAGDEHLPEDRAGARVPGGARPARRSTSTRPRSTRTSSRWSSGSTRSDGPRPCSTTPPRTSRSPRSCATS